MKLTDVPADITDPAQMYRQLSAWKRELERSVTDLEENLLARPRPTLILASIGAWLTPGGSEITVTDEVNWIKYNPVDLGGVSKLYLGTLNVNVTLNDGVLQVRVPGAYKPGTRWVAQVAQYGSVTLPTHSTWLEFVPGLGGEPFSDDSKVRIEVNPQMANVALPFSIGGKGIGAQSLDAELLVRGNAGTVTMNSCIFQASSSLVI